jgi:cytochrome b561
VYTLVGLVALHALAAIYHHHVRKDQVLARMLPWMR